MYSKYLYIEFKEKQSRNRKVRANSLLLLYLQSSVYFRTSLTGVELLRLLATLHKKNLHALEVVPEEEAILGFVSELGIKDDRANIKSNDQ